MAVVVTPETFTMVLFDQPTIVATVEQVAELLGCADVDITVRIDEAVPLGRSRLDSIDPVEISVEGGALEDPRRPRALSEHSVSTTIGRLLLQAADRRDPAFGDPPSDSDMPLPHRVAWDVYAVGRLDRAGIEGQRQRRLYGFRNRHGFTDVADDAFAQLWGGDGLRWEEITRLSDDAGAVRV